MSEHEQAISELESDGVLDGFRWAWESASAQTLRSFMPSTGHDRGWVGTNAFKVFTDRLDRVFSCGRFEVDDAVSPSDRDRFLRDGLTLREFQRMPLREPGLVIRDDLNGSPGWRRESWRILLQSLGGMGVDQIRWSQKSWTKMRVANQPPPNEPMLPSDVVDLPMAADVLADLSRLPTTEFPITTLVCAYGIDASTEETTLYLGRPFHRERVEAFWHWRVRLDRAGDDDRPDDPQAQRLDSPSPGPFGDAAASFPAPNENQTPR